VLLFLDRLPLHSWVPPGKSSDEPLFAACFPMIPTNPGKLPALQVRPQRWAVDTRFTGYAYAWRHHLAEVGLNPEQFKTGKVFLTPLDGPPQLYPVRKANLWLISNIAALQKHPYQVALGQGIAFRDVGSLPNPDSNCPLLGMRALAAAGLKLEIDFRRQTVSVWVPAPWRQQAWLTARRLASGFATEPVRWG
jgi:hypothetical protein